MGYHSETKPESELNSFVELISGGDGHCEKDASWLWVHSPAALT